MPRLHPLKLSSIVLTILLVCPAAGRAQVERFARGTKGYARDQQRVATVTRVKSLADLLASSSPLTGSRVPKGDASWRSWGEGVKPFSVEMGGGCQVTGVAQRYDLGPLGSTVKLRELAVQKGARRVAVSLDVPVRLDYDDDAEALVRRRVTAAASRDGALRPDDHRRFDARIREVAPVVQRTPVQGGAMRRAMIWHEVLSKPVSLRDEE